MKDKINSPAASKINWTAIAIVAVNISVIAGLVPPEYEQQLTVLVNTLGPAMILLFRTKFTDPAGAA